VSLPISDFIIDLIRHALISSHLFCLMFDVLRRQGIENARRLFNEIDSDGNGVIELDEFIEAYQKKDPSVSKEHLRKLFSEADVDESGTLEFDEFVKGK
jgi:Ca2+-binding EF-hand superfamily protein